MTTGPPTGKVWFVGAGPGAADLVTLRGARVIAAADVVIWAASLVMAEVVADVRPEAEVLDSSRLTLEEVCTVYDRAAAEGLSVARVHSGDPSLWGAVGEQIERCDERGLAWEIVPGVSSLGAAAAVLGRELTVPLIAQSVVLTRTQARSTAMPATESLAAFAATRATLVLHLAITRTRELAAALADEYGADCPAVVVHRASQPDELVLRGTLADIGDQVEEARLKQAAVILVGRALARDGGESWLYTADRPRTTRGPHRPRT